MTQIAIVTGPLAPYRMDLYKAAGRILGDTGKITIFYGQNTQRDHDWSGLSAPSEYYDLKLIPGSYFPTWIRKLMKVLRLGKANPMRGNFKLFGALQSLNPNTVWIAEHSLYTLPALLYSILYRKNIWVATDVGSETPTSDANLFIKIINSIGTLFVNGVIVCSPFALKPLFGRKMKTVFAPHAIDSANFTEYISNHNSLKKPVILFVGTSIPRKGVDLLLDAISENNMKSMDFELRIVGDGDISWAVNEARKRNVLERVHFIQFLEGDELKKEYANADIFVLPSRNDTYGVVTHEAAVCGLPLLISKHAGSSITLVSHGKNGYVIDPENRNEFSSLLLDLLKNKEKRATFGGISRRIAQQYDVSISARKILNQLLR